VRAGELLDVVGRYRRVYANWLPVLWAVHRRSGRIRVRPRMGPELEVPYSIAHQLSLLADLQGAGLEEVRGTWQSCACPRGSRCGSG